MARSTKTEQIDHDERLLVRLAWACEIEGLTQGEAAERFNITRLRVNKALSEARKRGIVKVSISSSYAPCVELEQQLKAIFNLDDVHVVPTPQDEELVQTIVGAGLGHYLSKELSKSEIKLFGISWGATLNSALRFITSLERPDLEIISVMGGLTKGSDLNSSQITRRLAELCNADHSYFPSPLFADSEASRELILKQTVFGSIIDKIRSADAIAIAVGALDKSLLARDGLPEEVDLQSLKDAGGVGDLLGYILNADGELADHPINGTQLGMDLEDIKRIPNVILAAGGLYKKQILKAVLTKGYVNTLIIDEETARAIL